MKIGVLGDIAFQVSEHSINSFEELRRERSWKYAEHEIVKGKSKLQALGRQLDQVTFSGKFISTFCVPTAEMKRLEDEAEKDEPLPFVVGEEIFGEFVIERVAETWRETDGLGRPLVIEFEVQLKEYN